VGVFQRLIIILIFHLVSGRAEVSVDASQGEGGGLFQWLILILILHRMGGRAEVSVEAS